VDDLELSWQVLDLARLSLENKENEEAQSEKYQILLSDIYLSLGNVAIESGMLSFPSFSSFFFFFSSSLLFLDNLEGAMEEFERCMKIRRAILKADDRLLAEGYFLRLTSLPLYSVLLRFLSSTDSVLS